MSSSAVATVPPMMNMPSATPHDEEDHGAFLSYFIAAGAYVLKAKTVTLQVYDETINSPNCGGHGPKWQWKRKYLWVEPENDTLYIADAPADAATQPIPLRLCRRAEPITRFVASKLSIPSTLAKSLVSSASEMSSLTPSSSNNVGSSPPNQPHWIIRTADKVFCFQSTTDAEAQQWVAGLNAVFPAMRALGGGAPSAPTTARGTRNTTTTLLPSVDVRDVSNSSYPPTAASSPNQLRSASSGTASPISSSPNQQQQQQQHSPPSSAGAFAANNNNRSSDSADSADVSGAIPRGADPLAADESMPYFESADNQTANSTNQQRHDDFSKQVRNTSFGDYVQTSATAAGNRGAASRTTSRRASGGIANEGADDNSNGDDSEGEFNQTYGGEGYRSAARNRQRHNTNNSLYGGKPYMMRNTFYFRDPADAAYLRTQSGLYGNNNSSFQRQSFVADTARSSRRGSDAAATDAFEVRRTESTVSAATLRKRSQNLAIQSTNNHSNNNNASLASAPTFAHNNTFNNNGSLSAAAATYNAVLERAQEEERNQLLAKSSKPTKFGYVGDSAHARAAADDAISACRMGMWMVKGKSTFQTGTGTLLDEVAEDEARGLDGTIGGGDAFDEDGNSTFVDPYADTTSGDARPSYGGSRRGSGVVAGDESSSAGGSNHKQRLTTIANKLGVGAQWKKKFLWIDGREICYGNAKGKRETTFFIDEVRDAYRLALHEMEKVKAPDANKRFGWCMRLRNGRIIYFGGESDTTVNSWVIALNYLRPETPEEVHSREQLEHERALLEEERRRAWEHRMSILKAAEDARRAEVERRRKEEEQRKMQELVRVMFEAKAKMDEQIRKEREEKERREKEERETGSHLHHKAAAPTAPAEDAEAVRLREEQLRRQKALELQHEKLMQDYMEECHKPVSPIRTNRREGKENSGSCCSIQ